MGTAYGTLIQTVPFFSSTILVTTLIPVKFYLTFHEKLIQELFDTIIKTLIGFRKEICRVCITVRAVSEFSHAA